MAIFITPGDECFRALFFDSYEPQAFADFICDERDLQKLP